MQHYDFIILGAGSAGRTAAETLAEDTPGGSILLADAEPRLPYKRTQVSKNVIRDFGPDEFALHDAGWYADNGITLTTGARATALNPSERRVEINGDIFGYGALLLAAGGGPQIPFQGLPRDRWSTLWTIGDALHLRKHLPRHRRLAVVGSGVLGIEAAWQGAELGLHTILIGQESAPMEQYLDGPTSEILYESMKKGGIEFIRNCRVTAIGLGEKGLRIEVGEEAILADFIILAIGSKPNTALASSAGLATGRGILVDESLRTSAEGIWAAGDCAEHPGKRITGLWHSAEHQGRLAAFSMTGRKVIHRPPPFRLKCDVFGGTWFSGGRVNTSAGAEDLDPAETWEVGAILWRPRFRDGILKSLLGAAPEGMDKGLMKTAQQLLLQGADREASMEALGYRGEPLS